MDFLKIGKNKLKVVLDEYDLKRFQLEEIDADTNLSAYKHRLMKIIEIAEQNNVFFVGGDKLLLQFYPMKNGGELFVTRLSILTAPQQNIISKSENLTTLSRFHRAYFFNSISDAAALAKSICARCEPPLSSALYITEDGFAVIDIEDCQNTDENLDFYEISEFSDSITTYFFIYLREHSIPVYKTNAIKELSLL
jgi:hypothetical protein